jgi:hypothetical protein
VAKQKADWPQEAGDMEECSPQPVSGDGGIPFCRHGFVCVVLYVASLEHTQMHCFFKKHRAFALEICRIKQQRKKTPAVPTILPDRDPKQSRDQQQEKERSVHGHLEKSYL